jgi:hypothetical protein
MAMIGDFPVWPTNDARCLAGSANAVQLCSAATADVVSTMNLDAERSAAAAAGLLYVPTVPWICAERCEPVIADTRVFASTTHMTQSYAAYLTGALGEALQPVLA